MAPLDTELIEPVADTGPTACLEGKYDILCGSPTGQFDTPSAAAFRAIDRARPTDALFALICHPDLPPRREVIDALASLRVDALMTPHGWGVIDWPPLHRRCFALVFEEPGGTRVAERFSDTIAPSSADDILNVVLPSLVTALKALSSFAIAHRAIRPTNLFRRAVDGKIVLGECVSAPPAVNQPLACETIESGLAQPVGRGAGTAADDLYALGVTLVFLLLGHDPSNGLGDAELLADKINRGSFGALLGKARPPLGVIELIRGLLSDDPRERWTLQDVDGWLQRSSLALRQSMPTRRASRPLELGGTGHVTARTLAQGFAADTAAAAKLVRSGDFDIWLQRSLGDPERIAAVANAITETSITDAATHEGRLVARIAMALDPRAPLRYGTLSAAIDGLGPALAAAYRAGTGAAIVAEAMMARLPQFWYSVQPKFRPEATPQIRQFDRLRRLLDDRRPGFGLERILYELNPGLHCQSPSVESDHVVDPSDLLAALERGVGSGRVGDLPVDRHVAAFVAVRCRTAIADWHDDLASGNPQQRGLGMLQVLAKLQSLYGPATVPALAGQIWSELPGQMNRYRSHSRRTRINAALARLRDKGRIAEVVALVASPGELRRDESEFRAAREECAGLKRSLAALRVDPETRTRETVELGGRLALTAAVLLGWIGALASLQLAG